MRRAAELARAGCPEGCVVTARQQTAGRGRHSRSWLSAPGQGLYLSAVLRPQCSPDQAPVLTLVIGLAVKEALETTTGVRCDIRWPNDILIAERKCCGILVEMEAERRTVSHVVAGIGVNLNHEAFPEDLAATATSLWMETGRTWSRDDILPGLLDALEACYGLYERGGSAPIMEAFQRASSYVSGRRVVVEGLPDGSDAPREGVTAGLNASGQLLLRAHDGTVAPVVAGSVRPDPCTM